jgi:hypothetical protein
MEIFFVKVLTTLPKVWRKAQGGVVQIQILAQGAMGI